MLDVTIITKKILATTVRSWGTAYEISTSQVAKLYMNIAETYKLKSSQVQFHIPYDTNKFQGKHVSKPDNTGNDSIIPLTYESDAWIIVKKKKSSFNFYYFLGVQQKSP